MNIQMQKKNTSIAMELIEFLDTCLKNKDDIRASECKISNIDQFDGPSVTITIKKLREKEIEFYRNLGSEPSER